MANYTISKENKNHEIVFINGQLKGYGFNPKSGSFNSRLKINQIVIVNDSLTDKILTLKFKQRYRRVLMLVLSILNGADTSEGDVVIVLDEIAKLQDILLHKYKKFLKKEKERLFLEQLKELELKMRAKLQEMKNIEYYKNLTSLFMNITDARIEEELESRFGR